MHRRSLLKSLAVVPAAATLPQLHATGAAARTPKESLSGAAIAPEQAAQPIARFFTGDEFAALKKLCGIVMPPYAGYPGALDVAVPEFLDFLISQSPSDRQDLYREGLAELDFRAREGHQGRVFADLHDDDADAILAPLHEPWTYNGPKQKFAQFLSQAKRDVIEATQNSSEWQAAKARRTGHKEGFEIYWRTIG